MQVKIGPIAFYLSEIGSGGVERILLTLAHALAEEGYEVDFVVGEKRGDFKFLLEGEKIQVHLLASSGYIRSRLALLRADPKLARLAPHLCFSLRFRARMLWLLPSLAAYLAKRRPSVLMTATPFCNIEAVLARQLAKVPTRLVLSEHSHLSVGVDKIQQRLRLLAPAMRHTYPQAEAVVAVSRGVAEDLVRVLGFSLEQLKVIYNPVIDQSFRRRSLESVDHPWFREKSIPVIVAVGRIARQKDYSTLLRAFAKLNARRPCRLVILGSGKAKVQRRLQELALNLGLTASVEFLGFKPNPLPYIANADLLVLSSLWEGLPTVLIEALACGTPVVSTDCPSGPAEILEGGRYGRLVPVGDAWALAEAMAATLDHPPERELLRERARDFDETRAIEAYQSILLGSCGVAC
ncbi:MAG: glycosyltransferase [Methylohalobius sp.]|nr:glycosyltransferase [Methylohalobius sp.]